MIGTIKFQSLAGYQIEPDFSVANLVFEEFLCEHVALI